MPKNNNQQSASQTDIELIKQQLKFISDRLDDLFLAQKEDTKKIDELTSSQNKTVLNFTDELAKRHDSCSKRFAKIEEKQAVYGVKLAFIFTIAALVGGIISSVITHVAISGL